MDPAKAEATPVPQLSTANSNTVANADGTLTAEVYGAPVNYQDASGRWVPISNDFVASDEPGYAVENEANSYTVSIPDDPSRTPVRFETADGWVTMKLQGSQDEAPEVAGVEAQFDGPATTDGVHYEAQDEGVKETIVIDAAPTTSLTYRYSLQTSPGITPVLTSAGSIEFRKGQGTTPFFIPPGVMFDSAQQPAVSGAVTYSLRRSRSGWSLVVTPDAGWLSDPTRVYPVSIDPSVDKITQKDCFLQQEAPSTTHCGEYNVKIGKTNSGLLRRGLFDFNIQGIPAGSAINNATAWFWDDSNQRVGQNSGAYFALFMPGRLWGACASWTYTCNNGETWDGGGNGGQISQTGWINGTDANWNPFDITGTVRNWLSGATENRGVLLRQAWEDQKLVIGIPSSTYPVAGFRPLLRIDYTPPTQSNDADAEPEGFTGNGVHPGTPPPSADDPQKVAIQPRSSAMCQDLLERGINNNVEFCTASSEGITPNINKGTLEAAAHTSVLVPALETHAEFTDNQAKVIWLGNDPFYANNVRMSEKWQTSGLNLSFTVPLGVGGSGDGGTAEDVTTQKTAWRLHSEVDSVYFSGFAIWRVRHTVAGKFGFGSNYFTVTTSKSSLV